MSRQYFNSRIHGQVGVALLSVLASVAMQVQVQAESGQNEARKQTATDTAKNSSAASSSSQGKYSTPQMAVLDTPSPASAQPQDKILGTSLNLNDDLLLITSIEQAGWEALPPQAFSVSKNSLVDAEGKVIESIDGNSTTILLEYGCTSVVTRRYRRGQRYCTVSLYRFSSPEGAYGAYSTMREGSSTVIARGQASSEDDDSITFLSGNCMVHLKTSEEGDDEAKEALGHLADRIAPRLAKGSAAPRMIAALPLYGKLTGSEKYFMGSQSVFRYTNNLPFIDTLQWVQSHGAAYADYQYSRPMAERLKLLLVDFGNPAAARSAFNSYVANISAYSHKTVEKTETELECKLSDSYLMCGTSGPKVFVITGARKASSPSLLARELRLP